jgi:hypothetical protein
VNEGVLSRLEALGDLTAAALIGARIRAVARNRELTEEPFPVGNDNETHEGGLSMPCRLFFNSRNERYPLSLFTVSTSQTDLDW